MKSREKKPLKKILIVLLSALFVTGLSSTASDTHLVIMGDYGCGCDAEAKVARAIQWFHRQEPIDFILTTGDNIYGQYTNNPFKYLLFWRAAGGDRSLFPIRFDPYFLPLIEQGVRLHAVLGNHDYRTRDGKDLIQDKKRFGILSDRGYYRLVMGQGDGRIEAFMLDSVRLRKGDSLQEKWLDTHLKKPFPGWRMMVLHHALYGPKGHHRPDIRLRKVLEPRIKQYRIHLILMGHNHFYARGKPVDSWVPFVVGNGGANIHPAEPDAGTACLVLKHGFLSLKIRARKIEFRMYTADKKIYDSGIIIRKAGRVHILNDRCLVSYSTQ